MHGALIDIMKIFSRILPLLFLPFLFVSAVAAQEIHKETTVTLAHDEVVNHDYFAAGETVTVSGTVNGDAYVAGGNIVVDGIINGDLLTAGGSIQIRGNVKNDIRVAGGQVTIAAPVGGSVTIGAGNVQITDTARIGGSVVAGVGNLEIFAPVTRGMMLGSGNVRIDNTVGGDITAGVGQLVFANNARVAGNVTYWSEEDATLEGNATVAGQLIRHQPPTQKPRVPAKGVAKAFAGIGFAFSVVELIGTLLLGFVLIAFAPLSFQRKVEIIAEKPWTALLVGFVAAVVTPVAILVLFITVIGIKIALILIALAGIVCLVAKIAGALFLGTKVLSALKQKVNPYAALTLGLILFALLFLVPFIGWIAVAVLYFIGLGGILLEKKQLYSTLRSRKLI